jgi:hypothetical protein
MSNWCTSGKSENSDPRQPDEAKVANALELSCLKPLHFSKICFAFTTYRNYLSQKKIWRLGFRLLAMLPIINKNIHYQEHES